MPGLYCTLITAHVEFRLSMKLFDCTILLFSELTSLQRAQCLANFFSWQAVQYISSPLVRKLWVRMGCLHSKQVKHSSCQTLCLYSTFLHPKRETQKLVYHFQHLACGWDILSTKAVMCWDNCTHLAWSLCSSPGSEVIRHGLHTSHTWSCHRPW